MTSVFVLIANENEKVKECMVIPHDESNVVIGVREALFEIYGAANVCVSSREIGHIPDNIAQYLSKKSVGKGSGWIRFTPYSTPKNNARVLVKFTNGYVNIANYSSEGNMLYRWRSENGEKFGEVVSWKELDE